MSEHAICQWISSKSFLIGHKGETDWIELLLNLTIGHKSLLIGVDGETMGRTKPPSWYGLVTRACSPA
jgi:hypothetical protein